MIRVEESIAVNWYYDRLEEPECRRVTECSDRAHMWVVLGDCTPGRVSFFEPNENGLTTRVSSNWYGRLRSLTCTFATIAYALAVNAEAYFTLIVKLLKQIVRNIGIVNVHCLIHTIYAKAFACTLISHYSKNYNMRKLRTCLGPACTYCVAWVFRVLIIHVIGSRLRQ